MIKETVFILGAGASCPYGFPSGRELREQICSEYVADCEDYLRAKKTPEAFISLETKEANKFVDKFRKSTTKSIDLFLARNPEFSRAGKRAIVFRILAAEQDSRFREETKNRNQDWYSWLFEELTNKLVRKEDYNRFCENDISFITFNYDRSLEHFLYDSLRHSFNGISQEKIVEQLNKIKICHVFGQIGPLEWQGQYSEISYRVNINNISIDSLCDNIRIVYEEEENPKLEEAQEILSKADRVFFLGFGYAEENLYALKIPKILGNVQRVLCTAMDFTKREINGIRSIFQNDGTRSVVIQNLDCLALLREYL